MGYLDDGRWTSENWPRADTSGRFQRNESAFRNWITADGSPGPSGRGGFAAARGRYHLYVSLACPWAHRTLIFRVLKGLQDHIGVSVTHWIMGDNGWTFDPGPGVVADTHNGVRYVHELYTMSDPHYSGRVSVPVLWDTQMRCIVNNESSEIIRMLNSAFEGLGATAVDFYPAALRSEIDAVNALVYPNVNNGVYRAGFATTQAAYEEAVRQLFETLDSLEARLAAHRYLCGSVLTEADWRLFTTLVRFDAVYVGHFKCNLRRIVDYPNLSGYLRELYQMPGIRETVNFAHIKQHYYGSHRFINPAGIVPVGPLLDLDAPHGRGHPGTG